MYTAYAYTNLLYASISAVHGSEWNGKRLVWSVHALLIVEAVIFRAWRTELQFTLMQFITHTFDRCVASERVEQNERITECQR